ncbi:hypothetical protein BC832DRAFT_340825 [Gaertneriomyces semiglobifer]|nr:hypothetical protein BC832DRAFT_340825 [Gaertneriomyces semiglobifer]
MLDLSLIDASITTLGDVLPFIRNRSSNGREPRPEDVRSLNLHSNVIRQLHASTLKLFSSLVILDLSSNLIEDIDGLKLVPTLEEVNLANNRIVRIGQLGGLYRLRKLVLSFNAIEDLAGIDGLAGDEYALEYLDIKGNKIRDIRCLQWLRDCVHLVMSDDASFSKVNPICKDVAYSRVKVFQLLPHLRTLDMRDHMNKPCAVQVGSAGLRSYADFLGQKESQENSNPMSRFPTILTQPEDFSSKDHNRDELVARLSNLERQLNRMSGNTVPVSEITNRQPQTDLMRVMQMMEEIRSQTKSSKNGGEVKASIGSGDDRMDRIEKQMDNLITALSKPKAPSEVQKKVTGKQISQELRATDERPRTKALRNHVRREESRSEALESDIDETLSVESESESDYMCVPTKIIKPSGNRKHSLVWKADAEKSGRKASSEKKHPSTADAVTGKRSVALAANSKPDNAVTLAANAKLITALEAEERRLRENEKQYASQIKALTDEVAREKAERTRIAHQNEQLQLQLNDKQKLEEEVCNLRKENSVLTEKVEAADGLTQELVSVKKDLAQMQSQYEQAVGERKDLQQRLTENDHVLRQAAQHEEQVVKALTNVEQRLEHAEDDKARLSVRFMKEREQLKIKLAEVTKEKDIFKDTVRELQKELKTLQSSISSRDREMGSQMRDANTARTSDIKAAVSEATELMFARHQQELEALSKELTATRNAYAALEDETELQNRPSDLKQLLLRKRKWRY